MIRRVPLKGWSDTWTEPETARFGVLYNVSNDQYTVGRLVNAVRVFPASAKRPSMPDGYLNLRVVELPETFQFEVHCEIVDRDADFREFRTKVEAEGYFLTLCAAECPEGAD